MRRLVSCVAVATTTLVTPAAAQDIEAEAAFRGIRTFLILVVLKLEHYDHSKKFYCNTINCIYS